MAKLKLVSGFWRRSANWKKLKQRFDRARPSSVRRRIAFRTTSEAGPHAKLSYEAFVAGRYLRSDTSALSRDSLGGTHLSYIRGFLNRILGLNAPLPLSGVDMESGRARRRL